MPYFTLTAHKTPEELIKATTRLLTVIKTQPKLLNAFCMEVEISDKNVLLDEVVMITRQYITDTQNKVSSEKDGPSIVNLNLELEKEKAYTSYNRAAFHLANLCKYDHCDNKELLKQTEFWLFLLSQWELLKFHIMTVNFSQWKSAIARSKYTQTCHAHVHLLFNQEDWEIMKKDVKSNELLAKLNIQNYSGPDYLLKNYMELEKEVLQLEEW
ncbi:hypothetical protein C1646_675032 [Rhizophagus diaphanus]|nr:hypothetical protein C1646_675032 [Rhizophagus diaphanus] [Rhizophagus sp. MUCL 43196]